MWEEEKEFDSVLHWLDKVQIAYITAYDGICTLMCFTTNHQTGRAVLWTCLLHNFYRIDSENRTRIFYYNSSTVFLSPKIRKQKYQTEVRNCDTKGYIQVNITRIFSHCFLNKISSKMLQPRDIHTHRRKSQLHRVAGYWAILIVAIFVGSIHFCSAQLTGD